MMAATSAQGGAGPLTTIISVSSMPKDWTKASRSRTSEAPRRIRKAQLALVVDAPRAAHI
jgi:arginase family enzyme